MSQDLPPTIPFDFGSSSSLAAPLLLPAPCSCLCAPHKTINLLLQNRCALFPLAGASCTHSHTHTVAGHSLTLADTGLQLCAVCSLFVGFVIIVGSLLGATLTRQQAFAALLLCRPYSSISIAFSVLCMSVCVCVCGSKRFSHYANFVTNFCDLFFATNSRVARAQLACITYTPRIRLSVCRATKIASVGTFWLSSQSSELKLRPHPYIDIDIAIAIAIAIRGLSCSLPCLGNSQILFMLLIF